MDSTTVPIPVGGRIVKRSWRYVVECACADCTAYREERLFFGDDMFIVPADCLTRSAPHEFAKAPPQPNTDAWRERSARGSKLLRELLTGEQLKVWDRFRALIMRYDKPFDCGDDCCWTGAGRSGATGLLITPEDARDYSRWEFNKRGELIHKRNIWSFNSPDWSYEDELISLLLNQRNDPVNFIEAGCRNCACDFAGLAASRPGLLRAQRIMRRIHRFTLARREKFALADEPGMFAGSF